MTLLLDTAGIPAGRRDDAARAVVERMSVPTQVSLLGPESLTTRMDTWQLGRVSALRNDGRAVRLLRTARHVRQEAPEVVSMIVQLRGRCLHRQGGGTQVTHAGDLVLCDLTGTYESDTGPATLATYISYQDLRVDVDVARRAMHRLRASPLYDLVRHHLFHLDRSAEVVGDGVAALSLGTATTELVSGLLTSAAEHPAQRDVLHETLPARIEAYMRLHLADTALTPELVAHAHHISVRTLHRVWSGRETTLMEWVTRQRLDGARRELGDLPAATVAAIARRWGFFDPEHFSRRFRAAYGMSPTQWRSHSVGGAP